jgi:hypothetical protein
MLISSPEGVDLLLPGRHLSVARHAISFLPYYYYCRPSRRHSSSARCSRRLSVRLRPDSLSTRSEKNLQDRVTRNLTDPLNGPRQCSWGRGEPRGGGRMATGIGCRCVSEAVLRVAGPIRAISAPDGVVRCNLSTAARNSCLRLWWRRERSMGAGLLLTASATVTPVNRAIVKGFLEDLLDSARRQGLAPAFPRQHGAWRSRGNPNPKGRDEPVRWRRACQLRHAIRHQNKIRPGDWPCKKTLP